MIRIYTVTRHTFANAKKVDLIESDTRIYTTEEAATKAAEMEWAHLTKTEKSKNSMYIGYADIPEDIAEDEDEVLEYITANGENVIREVDA